MKSQASNGVCIARVCWCFCFCAVACGRGEQASERQPAPPYIGISPIETVDALKIDSTSLHHVVYQAYLQSELLVRKEVREHLLRQFIDSTYPPCKAGAIAIDFSDKDRDGSLSTGDTVAVNYDQCVYDSNNGLGETQIQGQVSFKNVVVTPGNERWTFVAGSDGPVSYRDAVTGPGGPYQTQFSYDAEHDFSGGIETLRLSGDTFLNKWQSGANETEFLNQSGLAYEERRWGDGTYSLYFFYGVQDFGVVQKTSNPNGTTFGVQSVGDGDQPRYLFPQSANTPPPARLSGNLFENGGYPQAGSFKVSGVTPDASRLNHSSVAILRPQGRDGVIVLQIDMATGYDYGGPGGAFRETGWMTIYSETTTWSALAASASQ